MSETPTLFNSFVSELMSNAAGPLTSIALLFIGPRLFGWLANFVLNQQLKEHEELNANFSSEVRVLAAFYADCAVVLSNWFVVSAATLWNVIFMIEPKSMKLLLLAIWILVLIRLGSLLSHLTQPQDLSPYLPGKDGGVKERLLKEQLFITLQSLTIPLALASLKIPVVASVSKVLWP